MMNNEIILTENLNSSGIMKNPWDVGNLEDFLYYCCPECDVKVVHERDQSRDLFLQHATEVIF